MIKKIKRSSQEEAIKVIQNIHHHFPDSLEHALRKVRNRPDSQFDWYVCDVNPPNLANAKWVEHYHQHKGYNLLKNGESLGAAVRRYGKDRRNQNNVCRDRIEAIRRKIRKGNNESPIFFEATTDSTLDHIDGFHREIAWLLEGKAEPLIAYVAFARK